MTSSSALSECIFAPALHVHSVQTGYATPTRLEKLAVAPVTLRRTLMTLITAEADNAKARKPAAIWAKMNALVDPEIIDALYRASQVSPSRTFTLPVGCQRALDGES